MNGAPSCDGPCPRRESPPSHQRHEARRAVTETSIDYPDLLRRALLTLVREVLSRAVDDGFPGEHHAYINFQTDHPDVSLPPRVAESHPQEMTIVLQHQFWELETDDDSFSVTLRFDGRPERITVPYDAIRSFVDPSASFGLKFEPSEGGEDGEAGDEIAEDDSTPENVVRLDRFRASRDD